MEFLKGVLSEETYTKLEAELKDKKDVKLGNLATGEYVNKAKFDEAVANTSTAYKQHYSIMRPLLPIHKRILRLYSNP